MTAYKCDRCGGYFDDRRYNLVVLPGETDASQWNRIALKCGGYSKEFDVCPDCLTNFVGWLTEGDEEALENGSESC